MLCLGIESTAHTFSVGIMDDQGTVLSLVSDTYKPQTGGLKPVDVVEHHYTVFDRVLNQAILKANIEFIDLGLIAFSQGPGLGPCLRVGAAIARSLSLKLNIPIVGVNHCIAHVEIGRLFCNVDDPVTVYVSGGNTIISAFDSGMYQVFGETLDLAIGNMIDMVARDHGIPHPGGPKIEKIAKGGSNYINLPYIVKGMDLSFSGLYTAIWKQAQVKENTYERNKNYQEDLFYSLQETAFSMLAEVSERAIAHTEKNSVLLTGGVAANKRLQEMISYISNEHNIDFHVVPQKYAGDNGVMIAWTGILQFKSSNTVEISETKILPKWRMDNVPIPWRTTKKVDVHEIHNEKSKIELDKSEQKILQDLSIQGKIIRRGAEAVLIHSKWFNRDVLIKYRLPKNYRINEIDKKLRYSRTIKEGRTLIELFKFGIPVPSIFEINPTKGLIVMQYINGNRLKDVIPELSNEELEIIFRKIGYWVAKMHQIKRAHGDLTTSNIIYTENRELFFIDFGLTESDIGIEEKAMDLHLFKRVISSTHGKYFPYLYDQFIQGYTAVEKTDQNENSEINSRINQIELRGRYNIERKSIEKN
ncbi:MAG: bifunctional N(6)-L-threonylcarbamoyladenine synthase/serine/threonine protein kinase [Promethearchaeota archaeon]